VEVERVKSLDPGARFLYWIREREAVRRAREAKKPPPWTDDRILQSYRFCNVRRMDDRVSRWLLENWYRPYFGHPNMLVACALARFFNKPESLNAIGFPVRWEPEKVKATLRRLRDSGAAVFNAAYMVRGHSGGGDKIGAVVDLYVGGLAINPPAVDPGRMERTWRMLVPYYGYGSFMAGQVVADLRWALLGRWADRRRWAPAGPGSKRGLNRLLGRSARTPMKEEEFHTRFGEVLQEFPRRLPGGLSRRMEAMDWQNCLCEFDGYERTLWRQGRKKELFHGPGMKYVELGELPCPP
jgi:hypothetical protein